MTSTESITRRFLDAVESRDVDSVLACFATDASWQNVPHPRAEGHNEIRALLEAILGRSERVQWDLVSASYGDETAWLERVDRFWISGTEYAAECNGVLEFDLEAGVITELRDYVDLGEWRSRLAQAQL
jgi:limonene-1,2-epoxide hydrolase